MFFDRRRKAGYRGEIGLLRSQLPEACSLACFWLSPNSQKQTWPPTKPRSWSKRFDAFGQKMGKKFRRYSLRSDYQPPESLTNLEPNRRDIRLLLLPPLPRQSSGFE